MPPICASHFLFRLELSHSWFLLPPERGLHSGIRDLPTLCRRFYLSNFTPNYSFFFTFHSRLLVVLWFAEGDGEDSDVSSSDESDWSSEEDEDDSLEGGFDDSVCPPGCDQVKVLYQQQQMNSMIRHKHLQNDASRKNNVSGFKLHGLSECFRSVQVSFLNF